MITKLQKIRIEFLIMAVLLIISAVVRGFNMFHYPAYFDDEGTYMSEAWAFITKGQLSHYTYWYDHPPLGQIQLGLWTVLTGGFYSFGFALNSGRVFILLLDIGSSLFVYKIARNLGAGMTAAIAGSLFFILSPLAITLNRMVFLDNIMAFWALLSVFLLTLKSKRVLYLVLSSIAYGLAILSKETALIFAPILIWYVYKKMDNYQKRFGLAVYIFIFIFICFYWILYAILKNELLPTSWFFFDNSQHVSLVGAVISQLARGGHGSIFTSGSDIQSAIYHWTIGKLSLIEGVSDLPLLSLGTVSIFINLFYSILNRNKNYSLASLLGLFFLFFLIRGGIVLDFYVITLLPIFGINISLFIQTLFTLSQYLKPKLITNIIQIGILATLVIFFMGINFQKYKVVFLSDQITADIKAVDWITKNVDPTKRLLTDDYAYIDLRKNNFPDPNPIYYWKAQADPKINQGVLNNDWRNIDYLLTTPSFRSDILGLPIIHEAYQNSTKVASFEGDNYYKVEIYKVNNLANGSSPEQEMLFKSWQFYKSNFIDKDGKTIDPATSKTTSEGQSYALLRSVWLNDKPTFDLVLNWTLKNMPSTDKNLFAWWYGQKEDKSFGIIDPGTATDADEDIAFALALAHEKWGDSRYLNYAHQTINDIWQYETVEINGERYLVAGDWAAKNDNEVFTVNPSYLSAYEYRTFAGLDSQHDWLGLVNSSYAVVQECSNSTLGLSTSANIPPDWCALNRKGEVVPADNSNDQLADYSYDAIRTLWRTSLDYKWNQEPRALLYLQNMNFWSKEWSTNQKIHANYFHDGKPINEQESLANYANQLAYFSIINPDFADQIYKNKILPTWNSDGYWGDKNNYYNQNWVWFGIAFYTNNLGR